ncbi:MAG: tRNA1(Val) (adenine(37)-N6)-methyltransferase [Candidatus Binataceae bacterium]
MDSILGGALKIIQPRYGYRFSVDAILLGRFAGARPAGRILDLGSGSGAVTMILAALCGPSEIAAVELQPDLAALIVRNADINGFENVRAIQADLREPSIDGLTADSFDLVVANPPYRRANSGRQSPNRGRRLARAENAAELSDFIRTAAKYMRHGARAGFIFAAARTADLIVELRAHRLEPKRMRFVYPMAGKPGSLLLMETRKAGGVQLAVEPPLIMYERPGIYTEEATRLLSRL